MESRQLAKGIIIGFIIGALLIYGINSIMNTNLRNEITILRKDIELKDELITSLEEAYESSKDLIDARNSMIDSQQELIETLTYNSARQDYQIALIESILVTYDPEYEPEIDIDEVYGDLSFDEWWELHKDEFLPS
jgi:hypothetical protein